MNISDKKQNGVVFTPDWVAEFMVDEIFKRVKLTGDEKILDAGCGEGMFSIKVVKKFAALTGKNIEKVIEDNLYFIDISKDYIKKTEDNLRKLTENKINKFNSIIDDFCFYDFKDKFDFIIGNPPYIRIQNLNDKREKLQKKYKTATNGSIDIYFCFFEKALKLLNENGKISFITPNSHFHSSAGLNLRLLLLPYINKIINFDHYQVFKDATAYTAISFIENKKSNFIEYTENFKDNFNYIKYKNIEKDNLKSERWEFFDKHYLDEVIKLNEKYSTLGEVADIHYGLATLRDDIYIFSPDKENNNYFYIGDFLIEKSICVPIIKASTYKGIDQHLFIIFPYKNEKIIPENIFKKHYPKAFEYLLKHRDILENRDKGGGKHYDEFYSFGRSQGLKTSFGRKIITSTMNLKPRFYVIEDLGTTFYSGYCIKPKIDIDLYELCDILNSNLMEQYVSAVSKSYRGGYKSYAKSFIKDFIHPSFFKIQPSLFN